MKRILTFIGSGAGITKTDGVVKSIVGTPHDDRLVTLPRRNYPVEGAARVVYTLLPCPYAL